VATQGFDLKRPPDAELAPGVEDGFRLAAVGDCITSRPLAPQLERLPGFTSVIGLLRDASVAFGNLETSIFDVRRFAAYPRVVNDWGLVSTPEVADDLAALGFSIMSRANNHAMDWGIEGMRETGRRIDEANIVHAGTGETLSSASAPRYLETPHGRVGLVSLYTTHAWDQDSALDQFREVPGKPGVNTLRVTRVVEAPESVVEGLRAIYRAMLPDSIPPPQLEMFDTRFIAGTETKVHYEPDAEDVARNLRNIRLGKQHSDFLVVSAHVHEDGADPDTPPDHIIAFARAAIDAGADVFVGHGVHRLWPVEIYRGRPILYGLGNFFWSDIQEAVHGALYANARPRLKEVFRDPDTVTDADLNLMLNADDFAGGRFFESAVAEITSAGGRTELRLHPIDLGYGEPLTRSGVPRSPETGFGEAVLKRIAAMSELFGTTISIKDGIGLVGTGT